MRNGLQDDIIVSSPRTHQQLDELGVRMIDMGTNTSDVKVRPRRDGTRIMTSDDSASASFPLVDVILPTGENKQVPILHINLSILGYEPEALRGSHMITQDTGIQENSMIPQLDGPVSFPARGRRRLPEDIRIMEQEYSQGGTYLQGTSTSRRKEYPRESNDDTYNDRRSYRDQRPPERGRYQGQNGRPPDRRRYQDRGYSRRRYPN